MSVSQDSVKFGFCEEAVVDGRGKDPVKTSQLYKTEHLPERFEKPHIFKGYGQEKQQHPLYRTTSSSYGWFAPGYHSVPNVFFPLEQKFSSQLAAAGMYRDYSLNTSLEKPSFI